MNLCEPKAIQWFSCEWYHSEKPVQPLFSCVSRYFHGQSLMESNPNAPAPKPPRKLSNEITAAIITGVFGLATVLISTVVPKVLPEKKETPQPTATIAITSTMAVTPSLVSSTGLATDVVLVESSVGKSTGNYQHRLFGCTCVSQPVAVNDPG